MIHAMQESIKGIQSFSGVHIWQHCNNKIIQQYKQKTTFNFLQVEVDSELTLLDFSLLVVVVGCLSSLCVWGLLPSQSEKFISLSKL